MNIITTNLCKRSRRANDTQYYHKPSTNKLSPAVQVPGRVILELLAITGLGVIIYGEVVMLWCREIDVMIWGSE